MVAAGTVEIAGGAERIHHRLELMIWPSGVAAP